MYCKNCGKEINDNAIVCIKCGAQVAPLSKEIDMQNDKPSAVLNVLSFLFPLVGFILYLCMKQDTPLAGKSYGKWALIGVIVRVGLTLIPIILTCGLVFVELICKGLCFGLC